MANAVRGLRNLRTLSGRVDQVAEPYRAYMQITCLEMEKARRDAERRSALERIAEIDARLGEIEVEKAKLLERLPRQGRAPAPEDRKSKPSTHQGPPGFKIRY